MVAIDRASSRLPCFILVFHVKCYLLSPFFSLTVFQEWDRNSPIFYFVVGSNGTQLFTYNFVLLLYVNSFFFSLHVVFCLCIDVCTHVYVVGCIIWTCQIIHMLLLLFFNWIFVNLLCFFFFFLKPPLFLCDLFMI